MNGPASKWNLEESPGHGQAEHLAGATSHHLAGAGACWSSRRPCWDWEHAAVSGGAPPSSLQPAACSEGTSNLSDAHAAHAPSHQYSLPCARSMHRNLRLALQRKRCLSQEMLPRHPWRPSKVSSLLQSFARTASLHQMDRELEHKTIFGNRNKGTYRVINLWTLES